MSKKQIKEFIEWFLIDCIGIGVGIKEYIGIETDVQKKEIANQILTLTQL